MPLEIQLSRDENSALMVMVTALAQMPALRERVQVQHTDRGGHCRECGPPVGWPCQIARIAAEASRLTETASPRQASGQPRLPHPRPPRTQRLIPPAVHQPGNRPGGPDLPG